MEKIQRTLRLGIASAIVLASVNAQALDLNFLGKTNKTFNGAKAAKVASSVKPSVSSLKSGFSRLSAGGWRKGTFTSKLGLLGVVGMGAMIGLTSSGCGGGGGSSGGGVSCPNELDIHNTTWLETFDVYVDGWYVTSIAAGDTKGLCMSSGFHTVDLYESYSGEQILADSIDFAGTGWTIGWDVNDPFEAELDVDNDTGGYVELWVDGIWYDDVPTGTWAYPVRSGSHLVELIDYEDGEVFYSGFDSFSSGISYLYTVSDPACVEFSVFNDTGEWIDLNIDGVWYENQPDFSTWSYWADSGFHSVDIYGDPSGFNYYFESGTYGCGTYFIDVF